MSTLRLVIVAIALLAAACSATAMGPPQIEVDSHCGMLVSEPVYAAAYQAAGHDPRVFDDIGCMLKALRTETASPITVWLQDAAGGGWINADAAAIVASPRIPTPMNGGLLAYADGAAAEHAAEDHQGRVMRSLQELMAWKEEAK
jgi:copper chaperone NosL